MLNRSGSFKYWGAGSPAGTIRLPSAANSSGSFKHWHDGGDFGAVFDPTLPNFVTGATGKIPEGTHQTSVTVTIPATTAGNTLVLISYMGEDPTVRPVASVTTIDAASGNPFTFKTGVTNADATNATRTEIWTWSNITGGVTSITVNYSSLTVASVAVLEYEGVGSIGQGVTTTGTGDPTISMNTAGTNSLMVGGFSIEGTAISPFAFYTATSGFTRFSGLPLYGAGDGAPDNPGVAMEVRAPVPATRTLADDYSALGPLNYAGAAIELLLAASGGVIPIIGRGPGPGLRLAGPRGLAG